MICNRYSVALIARLVLLFLTFYVIASMAVDVRYPTGLILVSLFAAWQFYALLALLHKQNRELARFMLALRHADFSPHFDLEKQGLSFADLGQQFKAIQQHYMLQRSQHETTVRQLQALLDHVPVPLMSLSDDGSVALRNNAARRLFQSQHIGQQHELSRYGHGFADAVSCLKAGERRLLDCCIDGVDKRLSIMVSEIVSGAQSERLISLQDIQIELDDAQQRAWQDLVRVLTHEIMNSITPVASLAKTTTALVQELSQTIENAVPTKAVLLQDLDDVQQAVEAVGRRSDGLMQFVQRYRQLSQLQAPNKTTFSIEHWFNNAVTLLSSEWQGLGIEVRCTVKPSALTLFADREMLDQVLINLLRNAQQALVEASLPHPLVQINAYVNKVGRTVIEVMDNGPGIDASIVDSVFVPFFTTKREGSGVGLALTRQVMISHDGVVSLTSNSNDGTRVLLIF